MSVDTKKIHAAIDTLAGRPAPPSSVDVAAALSEAHRLIRRRRRVRAGMGSTAGILAVACAVALLPNTHGGSGGGQTVGVQAGTTASPAIQAVGTDPLTLSGTFGWLPTYAANVGYSLQDYSKQVQAVARGVRSAATMNTPMIWLTIYPKGTTPTLSTFASGTTQLRVDAPDVNGHTAYWVTASSDDPTNSGDTYLRWQSADGQWGELHGYYLASDSITADLLRVAAGVDFAPHAVPLPLAISGLPSPVVTTAATIDRPSLDGSGAWDVEVSVDVGGAEIAYTVTPAGTTAGTAGTTTGTAGTASTANTGSGSGSAKPLCKTANHLTACVALASGKLPPSLSGGGLAGLLNHTTLLGPDPANWTTAVIRD